jgi:hypothetical protein
VRCQRRYPRSRFRPARWWRTSAIERMWEVEEYETESAGESRRIRTGDCWACCSCWKMWYLFGIARTMLISLSIVFCYSDVDHQISDGMCRGSDPEFQFPGTLRMQPLPRRHGVLDPVELPRKATSSSYRPTGPTLIDISVQKSAPKCCARNF